MFEQELRDKPIKMVVPSTFAQVMTFTSFLFLLYTQNKTFYELLPTGDEDYGTKHRDMEKVLERDTRANQWNAMLFQHLLDTSRFGTGVLECCWTRKMTRIYVPEEPVVATIAGVETEVRAGSEWREYLKYEGNLVRPVSPYRWFPDTQVSDCGFSEGRVLRELRRNIVRRCSRIWRRRVKWRGSTLYSRCQELGQESRGADEDGQRFDCAGLREGARLVGGPGQARSATKATGVVLGDEGAGVDCAK